MGPTTTTMATATELLGFQASGHWAVEHALLNTLDYQEEFAIEPPERVGAFESPRPIRIRPPPMQRISLEWQSTVLDGNTRRISHSHAMPIDS